MVTDPSVTSGPGPSPGAKDKIRLRLCKDGSLRWLSHHDLLRTFERMLRRSRLPIRSTQGFHPHPRLVFALPLPLGVVGRDEVAEIELDEAVPANEVRERLSQQCPPGLAITRAYRISPRQTVHVLAFTYAVQVPADRVASARIAEALATTEWIVERAKPTLRRVDVRPFLRDLRLEPHTGWLEMDLWLRPTGTARPEEILSLCGLGDLVQSGAVLERVRLELDEDTPYPPATPQA